MFHQAIARRPGPDFALGLTTATGEAPPDYPRFLVQHAAYLDVLRSLGLAVEVLDPLPGFPDAHFVEDVAVVTPEVAVLTRPGAPSRRGEAEPMAPVLARYRELVRIPEPGTLDGGDVLMVGRHVFVGLSDRTNPAGAKSLGAILERHGYTWSPVPVGAGLHLKSSVTWAGEDMLILAEGFRRRPEFAGYRQIVVDAAETYAANTLWINGHLLTPAGYPRLRARLEHLGLPVHELDTSEARKMDGGLTCLSLRF
jgi:dimethylargininase